MPSRIALLAGCFNRKALHDEDIIKQQLETETKLVTTNPNKPTFFSGVVVQDAESEDTAETYDLQQTRSQNLSFEKSREESVGNHRSVYHVNSTHAPSRSYDGISTTSSSSTSAIQPTINVHVCNSSSCQMCKKNSKGVQFIAADPLCKDTVDALRFLPSSYWNMGGDLYTLNSMRTANSDIETTISRASSKGSKGNKRSTKLVSGERCVL
jgi:Cu/Zn superoxide dismutase